VTDSGACVRRRFGDRYSARFIARESTADTNQYVLAPHRLCCWFVDVIDLNDVEMNGSRTFSENVVKS
jgi:hypothetical protein